MPRRGCWAWAGRVASPVRARVQHLPLHGRQVQAPQICKQTTTGTAAMPPTLHKTAHTPDAAVVLTVEEPPPRDPPEEVHGVTQHGAGVVVAAQGAGVAAMGHLHPRQGGEGGRGRGRGRGSRGGVVEGSGDVPLASLGPARERTKEREGGPCHGSPVIMHAPAPAFSSHHHVASSCSSCCTYRNIASARDMEPS